MKMILRNYLAIALLTSLASSLTANAVPVALVGRADGGLSCYPIGIDEVKRLPGWKKIEKYAQDNWGGGGVNIVTNPEDYPDRPADACMKDYRVPTKFNSKPQCSTSSAIIRGRVDGTTQQVDFSQEVGTEETGSWTVTKASSLTVGAKFSISVGVEGVGDASGETWMEATIQDERSKSFSTTSKDTYVTNLGFNQTSGQRCRAELKTTKCSAVYRGKVPIVASGYVWFNYEDKRKRKINPNNDGAHFKYSANINKILSEAERTMYIEFQGPVNTQIRTGYNTDCSGGDELQSEVNTGAALKSKGSSGGKKGALAKPGKKGSSKPGGAKGAGKRATKKKKGKKGTKAVSKAKKGKKGTKAVSKTKKGNPATPKRKSSSKGKAPATKGKRGRKGKAGRKTLSTKKKASSKSPASKKRSTKKPGAKKSLTKKAASKKRSTKKGSSKKSLSKKRSTKKRPTKKALSKKKSSKKLSSKKPSSKKPSTKKPSPKKRSGKKPATKKRSTKKAVSKKKSSSKKPSTKTPASKASTKKLSTKKKSSAKTPASKKRSAKKPSSKTPTTTKKSTAKKRPTKKPSSKKSSTKKPSTKKTPTKKVSTKKSSTKEDLDDEETEEES